MFHCNGWCFTWAVTAAGGDARLPAEGRPAARSGELLDEERRHASERRADGARDALLPTPPPGSSSARSLVTTAGAPPPAAVIERTEALGFEINHVYGLTETYGPITICEWDPAWDELDAGERARLKARQGVNNVTADRVRVVDDELQDVPADGETMGEIVMRGNNVMKGYFRDEPATAEAFRGGWFHSGDLGVMHPDGYLELRDRAKDIIISGGENISTIEVESALVRHPDVLEAAVIAIADEKWGERPKGFVTLQAGRGALGGGADRLLARDAARASRRRARSSSASCRRRRPARSRSTSCASASADGGRPDVAAPRHVMQSRVAWVDTDAGGRIHFTAAFRWAEAAETALRRSLGLLDDWADYPRREVEAEYLAVLRFEDEFELELVAEQVGTTSITYAWEIRHDGERLHPRPAHRRPRRRRGPAVAAAAGRAARVDGGLATAVDSCEHMFA